MPENTTITEDASHKAQELPSRTKLSLCRTRLRETRRAKKLSQQEVADILGINRRVYNRYETGSRDVPVWVIVKLCEFYACSSDYLLGLQ